MTRPACRTTIEVWEGVIKAFLAGREVSCDLAPWANSYQGSGSGAVE